MTSFVFLEENSLAIRDNTERGHRRWCEPMNTIMISTAREELEANIFFSTNEIIVTHY